VVDDRSRATKLGRWVRDDQLQGVVTRGKGEPVEMTTVSVPEPRARRSSACRHPAYPAMSGVASAQPKPAAIQMPATWIQPPRNVLGGDPWAGSRPI